MQIRDLSVGATARLHSQGHTHLHSIANFTLLIYNRLWSTGIICAISVLFFKVEIKLDRKDCSKMAISLGGEYKGEKLQGKENYRIWKTILESDLKSKQLWKYVTGKAIYPTDPLSVEPFSLTNNPLSLPAGLQPNNGKDTKAQLVLQEDYEAESKWAKKLILTSVENILQPTIVEKATSQEIWETLTGLFEATNKSRLQLLLCNTFAVSDDKYKSVTEKAQALMNLNAEIMLQKPKLKLHPDYLVMILMRSIPPKYNALLDILNTKEDLTWDKTLSFLWVKETELLDIGTLKEERAHYASRGGRGSFRRWGSYQGGPRSRPGSGPGGGPGGGPSAQSGIQFSRAPVKCYVCQGAHMFKDCLTWLATDDGRK